MKPPRVTPVRNVPLSKSYILTGNSQLALRFLQMLAKQVHGLVSSEWEEMLCQRAHQKEPSNESRL